MLSDDKVCAEDVAALQGAEVLLADNHLLAQVWRDMITRLYAYFGTRERRIGSFIEKQK